MPVEIDVGPPILTLNQGTTFMLTDLAGQTLGDQHGDQTSDTELGLFAGDTRFVSH